jgi:hypothetical protein
MNLFLLMVVLVFVVLVSWKREGYYATLGHYTDAFGAVKLEPSSYCRGGSYMNSSSPGRSELCGQLGSDVVGCSKGYSGLPIGFSYFHV